jgi:ribosomal protein S27AE
MYGRRTAMEIMFSMKVKEDGKTVTVLLLCPECREEVQMAREPAGVRFRCGTHGELGTLTSEEFMEGVREAQKKAADQFRLGEPKRIRIIPADPPRVN